MHSHAGVLNAGLAFEHLKRLVKEDSYCLMIEKCLHMKTFRQLFTMEPVDREGNIKIVCYTTVHSTTHAVCCDIVENSNHKANY